jgi:hypothetical protein
MIFEPLRCGDARSAAALLAIVKNKPPAGSRSHKPGLVCLHVTLDPACTLRTQILCFGTALSAFQRPNPPPLPQVASSSFAARMLKGCLGEKVGGLICNVLGMGGVTGATSERLAALRTELKEQLSGEEKDRRLMYFVSQGPAFFLNPTTFLLRYMRGTDALVSTAVMYIHAHHTAKGIRAVKAFLEGSPPEGLGMTPAQVAEAIFRSGVDTTVNAEVRVQ